MAFGKTVGAEPFDLTEAAGREGALVAVFDHAGDKLFAEEVNVAIAFEGRHRAAQPVSLLRRKTGTDDSDFHRLLLKERHTHGFAENLSQRLSRVVDRLHPREAGARGWERV